MQYRISTWFHYLKEYIVNREYGYIFTALRYELFGRPASGSALYSSSLGQFYARGGTIDFKIANNAYERAVKRFLIGHYKDYTTFLDIGANIGIYSIMMAGKGLHCHAFEPMPENFLALQRNVSLNHLQNDIRLHNIALGNQDGNAEFIFTKVNTGASRLASHIHDQKTAKNSYTKLMIPVLTLDGIIPGLGIPAGEKTLIKIDAEGMEQNVLEGAMEFLKTHDKLLIVMETKHQSIPEILKILNRSGDYECVPIDRYNKAFRKL